MTDQEILRLIRVFASLSVTKIRFTGGEPLLKQGIVDLVRQTASIDGVSVVGITTNGLLLKPMLPALIDAGLNRLNISLDSADRNTFKKITGVDGLERVFSAIESALESGAFPCLKINTVVIKGTNDHEISLFAEWALNRKIILRFIEFMPTENSGWSHDFVVSESDIRKRIGLQLEQEADDQTSPGPEVRYRYRDCPGRIGFISAVSGSFCGRCNRLRLTSAGDLYGCLFQGQRIGLKSFLRDGATHAEIGRSILEIIGRSDFRRKPDHLSMTDYRPLMKAVGG